jgi:hypothetical protein
VFSRQAALKIRPEVPTVESTMKIVSPGTVVRDAGESLRRTRLARLTCASIVAGWSLTALIAVLTGASPGRNAWLLTGVGIITGITWATRRWDEQGDRALQILLVAASLQAAAGTLAFDRGEIVAGPVFALMLAPLAGLVGRTPLTFALQVAVLAGSQVVAAVLGPERGPDAVSALLERRCEDESEAVTRVDVRPRATRETSTPGR